MRTIRTPGASFVPEKDYVETLFQPGGTPTGTYKVLSTGILFCRPSGEPIAKLVANRHNEHFFVSCSRRDGKLWYMFGLADKDRSLMGLDGVGYSDGHDLARALWREHGKSRLRNQHSATCALH